MLSIKLHEATRQFKISNKLAMFFLEKENVPVKSHSSVITMEQLELLREFSGNKEKFSDILDEFDYLEKEKKQQTKRIRIEKDKREDEEEEIVEEIVIPGTIPETPVTMEARGREATPREESGEKVAPAEMEPPKPPVIETPKPPQVEITTRQVVEAPAPPVQVTPPSLVVERPAAPVMESPQAPAVETKVPPVMEISRTPVEEPRVPPVMEKPLSPASGQPREPLVESPRDLSRPPFIQGEPQRRVTERMNEAGRPQDERRPREDFRNKKDFRKPEKEWHPDKGRTDREVRVERKEQPGHPVRPVRPDRVERPEHGDRPERPVRPGTIERPGHSGRPERQERPERVERPDHPLRPERPGRIERTARPDLPVRSDRPERQDNRPARPDRPDTRPARPERPDHRPESRPDYRSDSRAENRPDSRADNRVDNRPDSRADSRPDNRVDNRPDSRADSRPESRADNRVDNRPDSRPDNRVDNRPDSRAENRPDSRPESRPDNRVDNRPARSERPGARPDRPSRPDSRPPRSDRPDSRPPRPDSRPSRPDSRPPRPDSRPPRPDSRPPRPGARPDRPPRPDRPDRPDRGEKKDRLDKRPEKIDRADNKLKEAKKLRDKERAADILARKIPEGKRPDKADWREWEPVILEKPIVDERKPVREERRERTKPVDPEWDATREGKLKREKAKIQTRRKEKEAVAPIIIIDEEVPIPIPIPVIIEKERFEPDYVKRARSKRKPATPPVPPEPPKKKERVYTVPGLIQTSNFINVKELAEKLNLKLKDIEDKLRQLKIEGMEFFTNQVLESEDINKICSAFNVGVDIVSYEDDIFHRHIEKFKSELSPRAPVVTVMGHVDHGKTTLLDTLRNTRVADREAGGITQKIGAYKLTYNHNDIIFIDTPGHEAFTNIRARGAKVTDIVVLVVAANDGVQPQTVEAINHARAAEVPIVVAINKIDIQGADVARVKQALTKHNVIVEDWGGDVVSVEISAKQNTNLDSLLEMLNLVSDMLELKAYKNIPARGTIIESRLDAKLGPLGTVLIQHGKIKRGDFFICGNAVGKVKSIFNEKGTVLNEADVPEPVEVMGFEDVPEAGELFQVTDDVDKARKVIEMRKLQVKDSKKDEAFSEKRLSLQNLFQKLEDDKTKEFPIIIKTDNFSSVEVLESILLKQHHEQLKINIVHKGIGNITESDVLLAATSGAIILGFNVKAPQKLEGLAKREKVEIKLYNVIYHLIEDIEKAIKGEIEPEYVESQIGKAEVLQVFKISKLGVIAGCLVKEGKVTNKSKIKVLRNNDLVFSGDIETLRRVKNEAAEVNAGTECGIRIKNFNAIEVGDMLEFYEVRIKT